MQARELRKTCHLNLAAVKVKQGKWKEVVSNCSKVLEADGDNIKALYRRAQAYLSTQVCGGCEGSVGEGLGECVVARRRASACKCVLEKGSVASC